MMEEEVIAAQLEELVTPAVLAQEKYYRQLGMRDRILNLPLMVAAVLRLIWRDVAGVRELSRILAREGFLWCEPTQVSQQGLSQRFLTFPAEIFEGVFKGLLPEFERKWHSRKQRPLPESIQFAQTKFARIWAGDGSTLEAIFKKLDSLAEVPKNQLAGKIGVVIDLVTRLPVEIWFQEKATASDMKFESDILKLVKPQTLILLDRGFCHYQFWQQLIEKNVHLITRLNNKASLTVERVFTNSYSIRDRTVKMGAGNKTTPCITMRLVEIRVGKTWYSYATFSGEASPEKLAYLTSVLDPLILPPYVVADLYGRRWRIEEAFNTVKRLLGLSYIWTGSLNGIKLQLWGTWLFYAVLVDLGDAVASEVSLPFDRISLEMIYRGLYHFYVAHHKGLATDPVKYFAAPKNRDLGVVKSIRKPFKKLIIHPFPDRATREGSFFFEPSAQTCLTTAL
ncbi:IS4 family transposase [Chamaesiphon sp.]|uniref:IS4 family transposase n=1 Tax=Chamaesiphon sp. TaxID=2814140 RepID=UPI00359318A4